MIRFRVYGQTTIFNSNFAPLFRKQPYSDLSLSQDLTIRNAAGGGPTALGIPGNNKNKWLYFRNISTAGQAIRIGGAGVTFVAPAIGLLLNPGEFTQIPDFDNTNSAASIGFAIADADNATLNIFVLEVLI